MQGPGGQAHCGGGVEFRSQPGRGPVPLWTVHNLLGVRLLWFQEGGQAGGGVPRLGWNKGGHQGMAKESGGGVVQSVPARKASILQPPPRSVGQPQASERRKHDEVSEAEEGKDDEAHEEVETLGRRGGGNILRSDEP